ncbi:Serine/threonine-protein kinase nak1-like protein [Elsinoe fawcettii]|nr:Serine/threonine-protein kinase nak1-like protein [Elsinoe fawcettii]
MDPSHLDPFSAAGSRPKQVQDAKDMQQIVLERASRAGTSAPPYDFLELIGKGSFGRVYKAKHRATREVVAVKIIDVDELDYKLENNLKDEAIEDFIKEVNTLKQVKDSNARNINHIREAFDLHSQLWIVSDYCSGGSVHTLMKPSGEPGLEEEFIIPIARELAIALKHVHEAGVIHRDIKCGNVLVSEDGNLQLCDFGVAAVIENDVSKRSTIIGTPYWMAPEMHADLEQGYGQEIDCWAYGCTIFEMATGMPPYHNFHPSYLRSVLKSVPRLEGDKYSDALKDFVAFCLQERPEDRPKAAQIVEHPYIAGTEDKYPTSMLRDLIDRYIQWERKGGQRMSLFNAMGAAAPQLGSRNDEDDDTWTFSTTDDFDKGYEQRYSRMLGGIASMDFAEKDPQSIPAEIDLPTGPTKKLTPLEAAKEEQKAQRGERYLERLFDTDKDSYDYDITKMEDEVQPMSDLPLRNLSSDRSANRETLIDLDTSGLDMPPTFNFDFSDVPTLRANRKSSMPQMDELEDEYYSRHGQATKRATKDWKFPAFEAGGDRFSKRATKDWKFPAFGSDGEQSKRATKDWKFPTLASENKQEVKRATKDWRFPTFNDAISEDPGSANRRTMDWTFPAFNSVPDAESDPEYSLSSRPTEDEPLRPNLFRTATEPVTKAFEIDEPRQLSVDNTLAAQRESRPMIDLDFGEEYQPTVNFDEPINASEIVRSTTPLSATASLSSLDPFQLESEYTSKPESLRRYNSKRLQGSDGSVVDKRITRAQQPRQSSYGQHLTPRTRNTSIDSTASSLVDDAADESMYGRQYNRSIGAKMRDQLRVGLQRSASQDNRHSRNLTDESYGDADTDGPYTTNGNYGHRMNKSNTSALSYDTDSSLQDEPLFARTPTTFPQLHGPHPSSLIEGINQEKLMEELDRILDTAEQALGYTGSVFRRREIELEGGELVDSATESGGPIDMTSEEERELASFS